MALPIFVFLMALMINFGTTACWKIRALSVARHAVWGSRPPRTGNTNPRPDYWPESASVTTGDLEDMPELDDPRVDQPIARGPMPADTVVNEPLLDPARGLRHGTAEITREYPLLSSMGEFTQRARTRLLDDRWQFWQMRWEGGGYRLLMNRQRRIPMIYMLAKAPSRFVDAYVRAVVTVRRAYYGTALLPLDRDRDHIYYRRLMGWVGSAPDFHPRLRRFCGRDVENAEVLVEGLIDSIRGKIIVDQEGNVHKIPNLEEWMTGSFISFFSGVIRRFENMLDMRPVPLPGAPTMRREIRRLRAKIEMLQ